MTDDIPALEAEKRQTRAAYSAAASASRNALARCATNYPPSCIHSTAGGWLHETLARCATNYPPR